MYLPGEKYKSTAFYQHLISTASIRANSEHEHWRYEANFTPSGSTWDAKHMDNFLSSTKWGNNTGTVVPVTHLKKLSIQLDTPRRNTLTPIKGQEQSARFFKTGPRPSVEKEPAYLQKVITNFTMKEAKNFTNSLVADTKVDPEKTKKHYEKEFGILEKTFDPSKLEYSDQPIRLVTPQQKRIQLVEVKKNQVEMGKWRERKAEVAKKLRVYRGGYRSGILGVDTPMNEGTMLYKDEYEKIKDMKEKSIKIERRRLGQLTETSKSNSMLEFFNKNFDKTTALPAPKIVDKNRRKTPDLPHAQWKNSADRLFHQPSEKRYSVERAKHLREQETKGRDWNFLGFTNNTIDIKVCPHIS